MLNLLKFLYNIKNLYIFFFYRISLENKKRFIFFLIPDKIQRIFLNQYLILQTF